MRIQIIAIGMKMPAWVDTAVTDYARRLPPTWRVDWRELRAENRSTTGTGAADVCRQREAARIRASIPGAARLVALDEHGVDEDSLAFAQRLRRWQDDGRDTAIIIGGPDGLDRGLLDSAEEKLRLSSLTLPHALVRVLLAEQLFRAWSILNHHPYHRGTPERG